ncbi:UNVERIFIED_CONTAM: hypothetical protein FKN15_049891 [Acipenser sinensis]
MINYLYPTARAFDLNFCAGKPNATTVDPERSDSYYRCDSGVTYHYQCSAGLVFNPLLSNCDFPSNAPTPNFCINLVDGLYPEPSNPSTFYQCFGGVAYYRSCSSPLLFNSTTWLCDFPIEIPFLPIYPPKLTEESNFCEEKSNGFYTGAFDLNFCAGKPNATTVDPERSDSYYRCDSGVTYHYQCSAGLVFNPLLSNCDFPSNAPTPNFCINLVDGLYPEPSNPSTFYQCFGGVAYYRSCSSPLLFNSTTWLCDFPIEIPFLPIYPPKLTEESNFCEEKSNGFYSDSENVGAFYHCQEHNTTHFLCPSILFYNPMITNCDFPFAVPEQDYCAQLDNGLYPESSNPDAFYQCIDHTTYYYTCPFPLLFNRESLMCDFNRVVPPATPSSTPALPETFNAPALPETTTTPKLYNSNFCVNKPSLLYADPEDRTGFYRCENEVTFYFTCHEGMVFDQMVLNCVVPLPAPSPTPTLSKTTNTPKLYNSNFCVNKPSLLYADPEDRTGFYRCENEVTFYFTCHEGMVFDQRVLNCVVPLPAPSPTPTLSKTTKISQVSTDVKTKSPSTSPAMRAWSSIKGS